MGAVMNKALMSDDQAWKQGTLSVKLGGLGVHSTCTIEVVLYACLALLHATSTLIESISPVNKSSSTPSFLDDALFCWSKGHDFQPPDGDYAHKHAEALGSAESGGCSIPTYKGCSG